MKNGTINIKIDAENWLVSSLNDEEKDVLYHLIEKIYYSIK